MKTYQIIKTLGPENGFTCAYRQWRAKSDCKYIHGYSLGFRFTMETTELDENSWVYDFGSFKDKSFFSTSTLFEVIFSFKNPSMPHPSRTFFWSISQGCKGSS